jgi:hypothetical protein
MVTIPVVVKLDRGWSSTADMAWQLLPPAVPGVCVEARLVMSRKHWQYSAEMLYYYKHMSHLHPHHHHHHHKLGEGHPPARASLSILRLSAVERLLLAACAIAVIWASVLWAMK